jgi:hypothetical protein
VQDVLSLLEDPMFSPPLASTPPCGRWQSAFAPLGGLLSNPGLEAACCDPSLPFWGPVAASTSPRAAPLGWKAVDPAAPVGWMASLVCA